MRRMFRPGLLAAAAMAGALVAAPPAQAQGWSAYDTPHLTIWSQVPDASSRNLFARLHLYLQALPVMTNLPVRPPQVPTEVFLLGEADFSRVAAGRGAISGMFMSGPFGGAIVVNAAADPDLSLYAVQHEYVHFAIRNAGLTGIPAFYEEGLAQFVQYFSVRNRQFYWGYFPPEYRKSARSESMPLARVLEVSVDSDEYVTEHSQEPFYARSLLILHYCLLDQRGCREPLVRTVSRIADGEPAAAAFTAEFGQSPEEFDRVLDGYLSRRPDRRYSTVPGFSLDRSPEMTPRTLAPGEAELAFADLLLDAAPRDPGLVPLLESALASPGQRDRALAGLAAAHEMLGQEADADARLAELDREPAASAPALAVAGQVLLQRTARLFTQEPPADEATLARTLRRARAFLEAALARKPGDPEAAYGYGLTQLQLPDDLPGSAQVLQAALERTPWNSELAMLLAMHVDALGDREAALKIMRVSVCGAVSPATRRMARERLGAVRCYKAG